MQKSKLKRFIASILLMITMISSTTPIFAASGSGKYVGGQYDSGMYTTDNQGSKVGILIRKLINNNEQEKNIQYFVQSMVLILRQVLFIMDNIIRQQILQ